MKVIVTGGAGFIGSNAASRFLSRGDDVILIDNLSRKGASSNLEWLRPQGRLTFFNTDVRDALEVAAIFGEHADASLVLHLAGQVAVTTSVADPRTDFEINVLGTLNVLEAARLAGIKSPIIYSSTNKVYGQLHDLEIAEDNGRCRFRDFAHGIPEERNLDFHSPYGCSKGAADQYTCDYHRIYGLNTVVMRQSCIYGCRQFGVEDQGWVAWFAIAAERGHPITIYGDGRQVRDVLYVDDLIDAYEAAAANIASAAGNAYNVGGGAENAVSLREVLNLLENRSGKPVICHSGEQRPGDQRVYISDIRRIERELGWRPRVRWQDGVAALCDWVHEHRDQLA